MMNKNRIKLLNLSTLICTLTFGLGAITACQSNQQAIKTPANPPVNTLSNNNSQPENTKIKVTESINSSLTTPSEAYKTAFNLRERKDVQGLKSVMSRDMLNFFNLIGADENKTVDEQLKQLVEQPQAATAEVRNEKITGETATLEYLNETGKWKGMDFVKEGSDWKMTIPNAQPSTNKKLIEKIYDNSTNKN